MLRFFVTEDERDMIFEKMATLKTDNLSAYLRKMAIDGYIIEVDHTELKTVIAEMQKIGVNVNQIARRVNTTGTAAERDTKETKETVERIWRLLRLSLSRER
jgi:hypothetical protein